MITWKNTSRAAAVVEWKFPTESKAARRRKLLAELWPERTRANRLVVPGFLIVLVIAYWSLCSALTPGAISAGALWLGLSGCLAVCAVPFAVLWLMPPADTTSPAFFPTFVIVPPHFRLAWSRARRWNLVALPTRNLLGLEGRSHWLASTTPRWFAVPEDRVDEVRSFLEQKLGQSDPGFGPWLETEAKVPARLSFVALLHGLAASAIAPALTSWITSGELRPATAGWITAVLAATYACGPGLWWYGYLRRRGCPPAIAKYEAHFLNLLAVAMALLFAPPFAIWFYGR